MTARLQMRPVVYLTMMLFILSGCASLQWYPFALDQDVLHEEVFTVGYNRIEENYIEPVNLAQLVPSGLAGLKSIDPAFNPTLTAPADADADEWGQITFRAITSSPTLTSKPPEEVYSVFYEALFNNLDGFSHYIPVVEANRQQEWTDGYGGIGVTFESKENAITIIDVFVNSPADKAGLKAGQIIYAINGEAVDGLKAADFADKVRGPIGSTVTLTVARQGEAKRDVKIMRDQVIPTTVSIEMMGDVAFIRISRFTPGTAEEFRKIARQALWSHARAVILDLEQNPGGILESATDIAGDLVPKGLVSRMAGRNPDAAQSYSSRGRDILQGLPLFVLIDGHSASAAEVLAAALHERGRATLIGATSYGKASVQNVSPLPQGGEIAVTWAHLQGPSGQSWMHEGLAPDICVVNESPCPKAENIEEKARQRALYLAKKAIFARSSH